MPQHAAGKAQRRDSPNTSLSGWTQGHLGLVAVAGRLQRTSGSFVPWSIPLKLDLLIQGKFDPVLGKPKQRDRKSLAQELTNHPSGQ